eukprot:CAMPEP_0177478500 /NCGR_PEP_ID=MMETSP0369-20130122/24722_1 /TAXON_ID=447022 ORGANISM="Scrippsiella hangoei-like, Strain SHHI-4" /NCGR_SAMPLE_ID=MMETSP0369 /ASSEMBLY_ACC=CAM_ASM_000364 /LENGTH=334 /DNA_ID=CAMNT_0018953939 /DNA_START=9 /DNA_END=1013 /DNA_ORIENTATION=+
MVSAPAMASMSTGGPKPSRAQCKEFLQRGLAVMSSKATRDILQDPAILKPGEKLKEMQRAGWEPIGFDADIGCAALEGIAADDPEMGETKTEFLFMSMSVYLRSLEDRRPRKLENTKKMPRDTMFEFFDACNVRMQTPDFQQTLVKFVQEQRQAPGQKIIDAQRAMLETLGFEADHGCQSLSNCQKDFPDDKELHMKFQQWAMIATNTGNQIANMVMKMSMSPEHLARVEKARESISKMSMSEQSDLVTRMQKKWETFSKLPPKDQEAYMEKQTEEQKDELIKIQVIVTHARMQQQQMMMRKQVEMQQGGGGGPMAGGGADGSTVSKPSQQQMM